MGILSGIWDIYQGIKDNSRANKIHPVYTPFQESPYAAATLGTAQQLFGGRMAGASNLEQNILTNSANTGAAVEKNSGDSATALATLAGVQGQTNQAFKNLQTQEAQNKYQLTNNLNLANQGMTAERDKAFQSMLQKFLYDQGRQDQLRQAGAANIGNGIGSVESAATFGLDSSGKGGGILSAII